MVQDALNIPRVEVNWRNLSLSKFESCRYSHGAGLYLVQSNKPGLCSLEIVFKNGRLGEHKKLASRMAAHQVQEGTVTTNAEQVADFIDFHGANLSIHADLDFTVVSMSCLQKHFERISGFIADLLLHPAYREQDLEKARLFLHSQLQHQLVEPDYVSYREFTAQVFGKESVYGYNTTHELIEALDTGDLKKYQEENYRSDLMEVFYCGDLNENVKQYLESLIASFNRTGPSFMPGYAAIPGLPQQSHHTIEQCAQVSLKYGMRSIPKKHPDYFGLYLLNVVLGDYFGSRLMKNLREDKGYTYDIHSTLDAQVHDGCFYISAELNPGQVEHAIECIQQEIRILQQELIPPDELGLVKNYICGNIMRHMDGPFQTLAFIKILVTEYGGTAAFPILLNSILDTGPERLRELAQQYLRPENMIMVTAGKSVNLPSFPRSK